MYVSSVLTLCLSPGCFSIQNVAPQPDGESSKVKVKVRVNIHGIFSVSGASLIEKQKGEAEEMQIDSEPLVQNEGRPEEQVRRWISWIQYVKSRAEWKSCAFALC